MQVRQISFQGKLCPTLELRQYVHNLSATKFEEFKSNIYNIEKVKDGKIYTLRTYRTSPADTKGVLEETDELNKTKTLGHFPVDKIEWFESNKYTNIVEHLFNEIFNKYPKFETQNKYKDNKNLAWRKRSLLKHLGYS